MPWSVGAFKESDFLRETGLEFRQARLLRGLSREALAEAAGVHTNTVAAFERGERDVNSATQCWILASLGCRTLILEDSVYRIVLGLGPEDYPRSDIQRMPYATIIDMMGRSIRELRAEAGLSLEHLSGAAGVHLNTLWNIERGLVCPMSAHVYRIYRALGVTAVTPGPEGIVFSRSQSVV